MSSCCTCNRPQSILVDSAAKKTNRNISNALICLFALNFFTLGVACSTFAAVFLQWGKINELVVHSQIQARYRQPDTPSGGTPLEVPKVNVDKCEENIAVNLKAEPPQPVPIEQSSQGRLKCGGGVCGSTPAKHIGSGMPSIATAAPGSNWMQQTLSLLGASSLSETPVPQQNQLGQLAAGYLQMLNGAATAVSSIAGLQPTTVASNSLKSLLQDLRPPGANPREIVASSGKAGEGHLPAADVDSITATSADVSWRGLPHKLMVNYTFSYINHTFVPRPRGNTQ
jgi:hypothetical protein